MSLPDRETKIDEKARGRNDVREAGKVRSRSRRRVSDPEID